MSTQDAWREGLPVDRPPRRVVSLSPNLTETLLDLDLGDRLIGVSDACAGPPKRAQAWVRLGEAHHPDLDRLIALQPDLVLASAEDIRQQDAEALRAVPLPVWEISPRTVFDTLKLLWDIMHVFDHAAMVPRVREMERAAEYTQAASRAAQPLRVFAPLACAPWATFNRDTYAHDVLQVCGGHNVFGEHAARFPAVSPGEVEDAQPDLVLLPDDPTLFATDDLDILWTLDIPAAAHDRIYRLDRTLLTWPGTRLAYALRDLPPVLAGNWE